MISPAPGWTVVSCDGGLRLEPPEGPQFGVLRYLERVRPIRAMQDVIDSHPVPINWIEHAASPIERLVTDEGEYAAVAWRTGVIDGQPCERSFGVVFADDFYARLTGVCFKVEAFEQFRHHVRDLLRRDCHMLGVRRRRFVYEPPPGWHGVLGGVFHATWLPPESPRDSTALLVMPAAPKSPGLGDALLHAVLGGAALDQVVIAKENITARNCLTGHVYRLRIGDRETTLAILEDERFTYAIRADSANRDAEAAYAALQALVATLEPLPDPQRDLAANRAIAISHWTE
jgi:hypothetical protein